MSYKIHFVGLTYFQAMDEGAGRRVMMPDGRSPDGRIQPHLASISVCTDHLLGAEGWRDDQVSSDKEETEFFFPPSYITFPGSDQPGEFDGTNLAPRIPQLQKIDPNFRVSDNPNWIACTFIRQGKIEALRVPGYPDDETAPLLAELTLPFDEDITITLTARKGWPRRTITVKAGSEIAIINTSRGLPQPSYPDNHFQLYGELCAVPVTLIAPPTKAPIPESTSRHPTFRASRPATTTTDCVPGCC